MEYKEPALIGFIQAAVDYLNYSKANGKKVDFGTLTPEDIDFLKDNLNLNFENDAAAILRGQQAFKEIIYRRQQERDNFNKTSFDNFINPKNIETPYQLFNAITKEDSIEENKASSKESAEAIDKLFSQIQSNVVETNKEEKQESFINKTVQKSQIHIDSNNVNTIKESIKRIKNTAGKELRIANNEEEDPVFEYVEKESDYYKLLRDISKTYTYLSIDFIRDVLSYRGEIERDYPTNIPLVVLHRVSFKDVEELRRFAEIMIGHEFFANVDEEKGIVDVFKQVVNTNGKIITAICDVANQASHVHGVYEGYKVLQTE